MTTKITSSTNAVHAAEYGNRTVYADTISLATTDIDAADIIKLCRVPAGTAVDRVVIKNTALAASGLTAKIGFTRVDGSAAVSGADTAVSVDAAFGTSATTVTREIFPPYRVEFDSYLTLVIGTGPTTPAAGSIDAKVEGEYLGPK